MGCTLFAARVLLPFASSQGNCLSLSFFWLCLPVSPALGRVVSFAPSCGTPFVSMELLNTAGNIYSLSWLKPDKRFERRIVVVVLK